MSNRPAKIELQVKPQPLMKDFGACRTVQWKRSLPFLVNPRGILIHRVRLAKSILWHEVWSHDAIGYWCGNSGRGEFFADPPKDRLLCAFCEAKAVAAGEKTAAELAGRLVCIGTLKAVRLCCTEVEN